jgi:hypothetical protein
LIGAAVSSGRWYWEIWSPNLGAGNRTVTDTLTVGVIGKEHSIVKELGSGKTGWGWRGDGKKAHSGKLWPYGTASDQHDEVIMVALDMDAGRIWFGRNGIWFGGGDPGTGACPAFQGLTGSVFPALSSKHGGHGTAILHARVTRDSWTFAPPLGFQSLAEEDTRRSQDAESPGLASTDNCVRG